jgi:polar amino acid transport system substrate-binding protein
LLIAILLPCQAWGADARKPLVLCFEDVTQRPWSTPQATGLNFELLKRVEKQLDEHFIYIAKPWRRCLEELRMGKIDGVIAAAYSSERRRYAVYPTLPDGSADPALALFETSVGVYLRVGGKASWDGQRLISPNNQVAIQAGYVVGDRLRAAGLQPRELVKSAEEGLRLLITGLFDVAVLQGLEASQLAQNDPRFRDRVQLAPLPYATLAEFLVIGRRSYEADTPRIEAIWRAIGTVRLSREYRQLEADALAAPH